MKQVIGKKDAYLSATVFKRKESAKENGKASVAGMKLLIAREYIVLNEI